MTHKLVIRLLGEARTLLGWTAVEAIARGDGALWADGPVPLRVDEPGLATTLSIHWCDLNTETLVSLPGGPYAVQCGQVVVLPYHTSPLLRLGDPPTSLPPVTVQASTVIGVPTGILGATGQKPH